MKNQPGLLDAWTTLPDINCRAVHARVLRATFAPAEAKYLFCDGVNSQIVELGIVV